jgi:hypothetical protein
VRRQALTDPLRPDVFVAEVFGCAAKGAGSPTTLRGRGQRKGAYAEDFTLLVLVQGGDRFRVTRSVEHLIWIIRYAPAHSESCTSVIPGGTVLVASGERMTLGPTPMFLAEPADYRTLEAVLIPEEIRSAPNYVRYRMAFPEAEIGGLLEPIARSGA